jgi:uncharacterized protein YceK
MTYRTPAVLGLLVVLLCSGCGTMNNLTSSNSPTSEGEISKPPPRIYGGVRGEWSELRAMRFDDVYCMNLIFVPLYLVDHPLSAIGDTLTLPYTVAAEVARSINAYYCPPQPAKSDTAREQPEVPRP